jgi:replicative DNA helicase
MTFALDLSVLRLLKDRKKFERYANVIPRGTVNNETAALIKRFGEYFKATDAQRITHSEFWPFLRTRYPNWKDSDTEFWFALTRPIDLPNPDGLEDQIITNLLAADMANKSLDFIEKWRAGGEVELAEALRLTVEQYDMALQRKVRTPNVELSWEDMIEEETNDEGLHWRLRALRESTRALRSGDFGIIAMRPDRGKTTLVASEVTYMAPQLVAQYPEDFRPVVWFNNEGPGRRILSRLRQSALGLSVSEIVALGPQEAQRQYIESIGGREDMIQVVDIHGFQSYEVEDLIRKKRPGLVVFDMIDNIQFAGQTTNGGERNDQILEAMYGWGRMQAVIHDFVGLATSQISAEGEGEKYPRQTQLKDSRTGKQGACDFIVTGGVDNNQPNTRYIGMTKNKIKREGAKYSPNAAYYFDADRGRLVEPTEE